MAGMAMAPSPLNRPHLLLLVGVLLVPRFAAAQGLYRNVSLGSSLTPLGPTTSWPSPSGDFAFGFIPFGANFLLGIWFDKTPNKTVVWSAKTSNPLQSSSRLDFQSNGLLVLIDQTGNQAWTANADGASVSHAAMLDSGNFVLVADGGAGGTNVWQSFDSPTDTILPTQELGLGNNFFSHLTETDYSNGRFKLAVQADGNLVLYLVNIPNGDNYTPYWSSDTVGNGSRLIFDNSGNVYMARKDGGFANLTSSGRSYAGAAAYQRATLDPDGVFRHYVFLRNASRGAGWIVADLQPSNICTRILGGLGGGACGYNAYCALGNQGRPNCQCPQGYLFLDPSRKYKGCRPNFPMPSCGEDGLAYGRVEYEIVPMTDTDWPLSDYEKFDGVEENTCRQECLNDCFCAVAIFRSRTCYKKKLPLSNGKLDSSVAGKALLKIAKGNITTPAIQPVLPPNETPGKVSRGVSVLLTSLLVGISASLNFLMATGMLLLFFCYHRKRITQLQQEQQQSELRMLGSNARSFTYKELEEATGGFKEELGRGGFGTVYKGILSRNSTTVLIAVKRLENLDRGAEKEFTNEVRAIGQTHHKNLVRLFGFCNEGTHRLLVYEFMRNGSLTSLLFESSRPDWDQRSQIAYGIARGISYLHEECGAQIVHCDIKPQNVLLDEYFVAKISDFGLAKLLRTDQTRTSTGIRGTRGYVAPEWFKSMPITAKVDVYSFGVMLLEIICCRKNVETEFGEGDEAILTDWAYDCYREGRLDNLVRKEDEAITDARLERFVKVALWCIQEQPSVRPSMKKVTLMLEGAIDVPVPPDPSWTSMI